MHNHTHHHIRRRLLRIRQYADDGLLVRAAYLAGRLHVRLAKSHDVAFAEVEFFLFDLQDHLADEELRLRRSLADRESGPDGALRV